jgi:hypothetical protein
MERRKDSFGAWPLQVKPLQKSVNMRLKAADLLPKLGDKHVKMIVSMTQTCAPAFFDKPSVSLYFMFYTNTHFD